MLEMQRGCQYVKEVYNILHLVWKIYHYSPKGKHELRALGNQLGLDVLKTRPVKGSRWLPHVSGALRVFIKPHKNGSISSDPSQYAAVLAQKEHLAAISTNADVKGRAKFISKSMKSVFCKCFCHFLSDLMFDVLSKVSINFHRNDLILPSAVSLLEKAQSSMSLLARQPMSGGRLQAFLNNLSTLGHCFKFQGITLSGDISSLTLVEIHNEAGLDAQIKQATDLILSVLSARYGTLLQIPDKVASPGPNQVIKDLLVFNQDAWPTAPSELIDFGQEAITHLSRWFQPALEGNGCRIAAIPFQWTSLKVLVSSQFKDKGCLNLWATLLTKQLYRDDFKDILHLVEILLVLPTSAAQCERAISA